MLVWKFRLKQPARGLIRGILALQRGGAGKSEGKTRRGWVGGPRPDAGTNRNGGTRRPGKATGGPQNAPWPIHGRNGMTQQQKGTSWPPVAP